MSILDPLLFRTLERIVNRPFTLLLGLSLVCGAASLQAAPPKDAAVVAGYTLKFKGEAFSVDEDSGERVRDRARATCKVTEVKVPGADAVVKVDCGDAGDEQPRPRVAATR